MNKEDFYRHIDKDGLLPYSILSSCEKVYSAFEKKKSPPYSLVSLVHDFFKSNDIASLEVVLGAAMLSELPIKDINPAILGEYVAGEMIDAAKSDIKKKIVSRERIENSSFDAQNFIYHSLAPFYAENVEAPFIFESVVFWYAQSVAALEDAVAKMSSDVQIFGENVLSHSKEDSRMKFFANKTYGLLVDYAQKLEAQRAERMRLAEIEKERKIVECKKEWENSKGQRVGIYSDLEELI
jgi:hypothetical protein